MVIGMRPSHGPKRCWLRSKAERAWLELAKQWADDTGTKDKGGDLDFLLP